MPNILTPFSKPSLVFGTWSTGYSWIPDYRQERNYAAAMLDARVEEATLCNAVLRQWAARPENRPPTDWWNDPTNPFEPADD